MITLKDIVLITVISVSSASLFANTLESYFEQNPLGVNKYQTLSVTALNVTYGSQQSSTQSFRMWGISCYSPSCSKLIIHEGRLANPVAIVDKDQLLDYLIDQSSKFRLNLVKTNYYKKLAEWVLAIPENLKKLEAQGLKEHERSVYDRAIRATEIDATNTIAKNALWPIGDELFERFKDDNFEKEIKGATTLSQLICKSIF